MPAGGNTLRLSPRGALLRGLAGEEVDSLLDRLGQALAFTDGGAGQTAQCLGRWRSDPAGRSAAQLESDLLRATRSGEIEVVYQPQFRCADDRLSGAEALARWNHPQAGPDRRRGAVRDCRTGRSRRPAVAPYRAPRWPAQGLARASAPVAQRHPQRSGGGQLFARICCIGRGERIPAGRLTLEVTEQVLLARCRPAPRWLWDA
jgi:predicted signal transduction protein with EAL and GGDEF domain